MLVIDASVYVAAHSGRDRHHARCTEWFDEQLAGRRRLVAPSLLVVEVAAAFRRLTGDPEEARKVSSDLARDEVVELVALTHERSRTAADVAARAGVRGADAVYLALARELDAPLITLDRQQLERGKRVATVRRP